MASSSLNAVRPIAATSPQFPTADQPQFRSGGIRSELAIAASEIPSRILGLADKSRSQRLQWLQNVISSLDHRLIREDIELSLAQAENQFDCLIIHGRDFRRMGQLVRRIHKLMPGKLLACLLDDATSKEAAEMLVGGADIVFSLRMDHVEARARLRSAYRRHAGLFDQWLDANVGGGTAIDPLVLRKAESEVPFKSLRRRERLIFKALLAKAGQLVTYEELEKVISLSMSANIASCKDVRKALKIAISRVRSILPDDLGVSNKSGRGYTLCLK